MTKLLNQCIVMPLKPDFSQEHRFIGLALHFLLGNVIVLNSSLDELWFGWQAKKLFSSADQLSNYCCESTRPFSIQGANQHQNIRFWVFGDLDTKKVSLSLHDTHENKMVHFTIPYSCRDNLVDFRLTFVDFLESHGIHWTDREKQASLWLEKCDMNGLDTMGKALMEFYLFSSFGNTKKLELKWFEAAVKKAPDTFMAHDLLGWAYYRNREFTKAAAAFKMALSVNPSGAGAMSGLMWCCVMTQDKSNTVYWTQCKARVCGKNIEKAKEKALRLYQKHNGAKTIQK